MRYKQAMGNDQRGMASIVITMVTMVIITLIVVGFATVSRREQRQSLDQLLSSQAFYAAESGVEDAKSVIRAAVQAGQPVVAKNDCTGDAGVYRTGAQTVIDGQYDVRYTCLKVNPGPTSVLFDGVDRDSIVVPITTAQPITSVRVTWRPVNAPAGVPSSCPSGSNRSFSAQMNWTCGYGVLRADLVRTAGTLTRASLGNDLANALFVPTRNSAPGQLDYGAARGRTNVLAAQCNTSSYTECTATFNNMTAGTQSVSLRLSSMYRSSNIRVEAIGASGAQQIRGVQAVIDSTGKASDVLRRIQVRLPLIRTGGTLPSYAISSNGAICKRFNLTTNSFQIPNDIVEPDTDNDMCVAK